MIPSILWQSEQKLIKHRQKESKLQEIQATYFFILKFLAKLLRKICESVKQTLQNVFFSKKATKGKN